MSKPVLVRPEALNDRPSGRGTVIGRFTGQLSRQVVILAAAQALFGTATVMVATVGALAGSQIAPVPQLATLPNSAVLLGTALMTIPASLWMGRVGRKPGFIAGALLGVLGGLIGALGLWLGSLWVLALGTFFIGTYQGFAQY